MDHTKNYNGPGEQESIDRPPHLKSSMFVGSDHGFIYTRSATYVDTVRYTVVRSMLQPCGVRAGDVIYLVSIAACRARADDIYDFYPTRTPQHTVPSLQYPVCLMNAATADRRPTRLSMVVTPSYRLCATKVGSQPCGLVRPTVSEERGATSAQGDSGFSKLSHIEPKSKIVREFGVGGGFPRCQIHKISTSETQEYKAGASHFWVRRRGPWAEMHIPYRLPTLGLRVPVALV